MELVLCYLTSISCLSCTVLRVGDIKILVLTCTSKVNAYSVGSFAKRFLLAAYPELPPKALMSKFRPVHTWTLHMQIWDAMHSFTRPAHTKQTGGSLMGILAMLEVAENRTQKATVS